MKKTKILSLLLAICTLLSLLASCGEKTGDNAVTTDEITEKPVENIVIAQNGQIDYSVIRNDKLTNDSPSVRAAVSLRLAMNEKFGARMEIGTDWFDEKKGPLPETAKEIVVGSTNRPGSARALQEIGEKDYIIRFENGRLIITGGSDEATVRAVNFFIDSYVNTADGTLILPDNLEIVSRYEYIYGKLSVDGIALEKFTVVYPDSGDAYAKYTAMSLADMILGCSGIKLATTTDKTAETDYEILIGNTNRKASADAAAVKLADDEFLLAKEGNKIVMLGRKFMCAGAAGQFVNECLAPSSKGAAADAKNIPSIAQAKPGKQVWKDTKNVILMIGDGMGRNQVLSTIAAGKIPEWEGDSFPGQTYCTTASRSVKTGSAAATDSAAAATALATGTKTTNGFLGMNYKGKSIPNVRELAVEAGCRTAILTTDKITGATPAGFLVHINDRNSTDAIQKQIDEHVKAGDVLVCEGSLGNALLNKTRDALSLISENGSRFFTMIEEAFPDKGGHNNDYDKMMTGVTRMNDCVAYAAAFTMMHPDTALIVTADHETGNLTESGKSYVYKQTGHSNKDVPVYGIGAGIGEFLKPSKIDNTDISKFIAKVYGASSWGE